jgi:glutaredoxin
MKIVIYSKPDCTFCIKAEELLIANGFDFKKIDISTDPQLAIDLVTKIAPGATTVPQIVVNQDAIGGYAELMVFIEWWKQDVEKLRALIKDGQTVTVKFNKADQSERIMTCTTNFQIIPQAFHPKPSDTVVISKPTDPYLFKVFDIVKNEWRSFKAQRLLGVW